MPTTIEDILRLRAIQGSFPTVFQGGGQQGFQPTPYQPPNFPNIPIPRGAPNTIPSPPGRQYWGPMAQLGISGQGKDSSGGAPPASGGAGAGDAPTETDPNAGVTPVSGGSGLLLRTPTAKQAAEGGGVERPEDVTPFQDQAPPQDSSGGAPLPILPPGGGNPSGVPPPTGSSAAPQPDGTPAPQAKPGPGLGSLSGRKDGLPSYGGPNTQGAYQPPSGTPPIQSSTLSVSPASYPQRDNALNALSNFLRTNPPDIRNYQPSIGRRIAAGIMGGLAQSPQITSEFLYKKYNESMENYLETLNRLSNRYNTLEKAAQSDQKMRRDDVLNMKDLVDSKKAQADAEKSRAEADKAYADATLAREKADKSRYDRSPEGQQAAIDRITAKANAEGRSPNMYYIPLQDGGSVIGVPYPGHPGMYLDSSGQLIEEPIDAEGVYKIGPKQKEAEPKEYTDWHKGYIEKHPNATPDEVASAWEKEKARVGPASVVKPTLAVDPETNKYFVAAPGKTAGQTPSQAGSEQTTTGTTRTMIQSSPIVIDLANKMLTEIQNQRKNLGPGMGRWNQFWTGKVGAPNPGFTGLITNSTLLATALQRMHTGARGGQAQYEHFKALIDQGKQSPENMEAALKEIIDYATSVKNTKATNSGGPGPVNAPGAPPKTVIKLVPDPNNPGKFIEGK